MRKVSQKQEHLRLLSLEFTLRGIHCIKGEPLATSDFVNIQINLPHDEKEKIRKRKKKEKQI